jgi:hypothetical protein
MAFPPTFTEREGKHGLGRLFRNAQMPGARNPEE